jgi:hypothetical protein
VVDLDIDDDVLLLESFFRVEPDERTQPQVAYSDDPGHSGTSHGFPPRIDGTVHHGNSGRD